MTRCVLRSILVQLINKNNNSGRRCYALISVVFTKLQVIQCSNCITKYIRLLIFRKLCDVNDMDFVLFDVLQRIAKSCFWLAFINSSCKNGGLVVYRFIYNTVELSPAWNGNFFVTCSASITFFFNGFKKFLPIINRTEFALTSHNIIDDCIHCLSGIINIGKHQIQVIAVILVDILEFLCLFLLYIVSYFFRLQIRIPVFFSGIRIVICYILERLCWQAQFLIHGKIFFSCLFRIIFVAVIIRLVNG